MQLRDYQLDIILRTRNELKAVGKVLIQAPTGAGKTALTVHMMKTAADRGKRAFFLVHQNELLKQTSAALWKQKLAHGMISSGKRPSLLPVQVASVQTLVNRLDQYEPPDLIIIDEAHRSTAESYKKVVEAYPNAVLVGLSATPERTDGKPLGDMYDKIVAGPSIRWLQQEGFLCDYVLYAPNIGVDTSGIKTTAGDFNKGELERATDKPTITGDAVGHYKKLAQGKQCVVMCVTVNHAQHVADSYNQAGIPAACIEGSMTSEQRERVLNDFSEGKLKVITNVQLLVEGVDIPAIEVVQWLRPTQSLIVFMQGNGRGLRPHAGKDRLLILDHVGNAMRHGLPCEKRDWSLEGQKKGKRKKKDDDEPDVNVQQCTSCYAVFVPGPDSCPMCGAHIEKKVRKIEQAEGELQAVDIDAVRNERKKEQGQARSLRDLISLGMRRGMNKPAQWGAIMLASRQGRKPTTDEFTQARRVYMELQG